MSKKKIAAVILLLLIPIIAILIYYTGQTKEQIVLFLQDGSVSQNPHKGFYVQVDSARYDKIEEVSKDVRLMLLAYDMREFTEDELSPEKIQELRHFLKTAKQYGMGIIFRAAYSFDSDVKEPTDKDLIKRHIEQISEVLNEYSSIITVVQAGILGDYGEWHSGIYLDADEETAKEMRMLVLKQWELSLDSNIIVSVRRPKFIREALQNEILVDRLGFYNDGLLSTDSDMGTYDDEGMNRNDELRWTDEHLKNLVNGGEMPVLNEMTSPEYANAEFELLHMTYLNSRYNNEIIEGWKQAQLDGVNAEHLIAQRLGYHLFLTKITAKNSPWYIPKQYIDIEIQLKNIGYATLPDDFKVYLQLNENDKVLFSQQIEIAQINNICNGESASGVLRIPIEMYDDDLRIFTLYLIIVNPLNADNDRYFVQLDNVGVAFQNGANEVLKIAFNQQSKTERYKIIHPVLG